VQAAPSARRGHLSGVSLSRVERLGSDGARKVLMTCLGPRSSLWSRGSGRQSNGANTHIGDTKGKIAIVLANGLVSQWTEEGAYVLDQCLWLFQGCEVSSRFHLCPTLDIVEALGK
jgi:hypothetical protein